MKIIKYGCYVFREYDDTANTVHTKDLDSDGLELWFKYDKHGNQIYFKSSKGSEEWREFDEHDNCIHYKDLDGQEEWWEYNENNLMTHYKKHRL